LYLRTHEVAILDPAGSVAHRQRDLMIFTGILSLFVIIPVYILAFTFAWRYRAQNKKANHHPDWEKHNGIEAVMWGIPILIILILSTVTWKTSHSLDPFKPLTSDKKPLTIQVVSLQWKWLFIYPEQKIATVNYFQMPKDTPVNFEITADSPMNSFWIPQLGSQIYAMNGMTTQVNLMADKLGKYNGVSANISGSGFADMKFVAEAVNQTDFDNWVATMQKSPNKLDLAAYDALAKPSTKIDKAEYVLAKQDLEQAIVMKYMMPATTEQAANHEGAGQ
jgi:cytochrome o ubiquinol oxidase subunit 2